ncbi:MAG: hypothetical protein K0M67_15130 [Thiobacillus sp.]|nr:hypothetical protein [Thiobacillus sp.]
MNATPSPELLAAALAGVIDYELLKAVAIAEATSAPAILDQLACYVAKQYDSDALSFEDADSIMNAAFGVGVSEDFWGDHDRTVPPVMFEVYQAFDAGEYHHHGDEKYIDPKIQYTKRLIREFLSAHQNDAQPILPPDATR